MTHLEAWPIVLGVCNIGVAWCMYLNRARLGVSAIVAVIFACVGIGMIYSGSFAVVESRVSLRQSLVLAVILAQLVLAVSLFLSRKRKR